MSRARQTISFEEEANFYENDTYSMPEESLNLNTENIQASPSTRRVSTNKSPQMKIFYNGHSLRLTLDSGAEISMIKTSVAQYIGATIKKTSQSALQADGFTPLPTIGETHLELTRDGVSLHIEALVVNDLDVDVLAMPFISSNDLISNILY